MTDERPLSEDELDEIEAASSRATRQEFGSTDGAVCALDGDDSEDAEDAWVGLRPGLAVRLVAELRGLRLSAARLHFHHIRQARPVQGACRTCVEFDATLPRRDVH